MNGDSYSSRGMASATTLPRIRKHETDTNNPSTADAGRYGSSRDHYVNWPKAAFTQAKLTGTDRLPVTSAVMEAVMAAAMEAAMEAEIETDTEVASDGALDHLGIEAQDHHVASTKSIPTRPAETIGRASERIGILDENLVMREHGIGIGAIAAIMATEE